MNMASNERNIEAEKLKNENVLSKIEGKCKIKDVIENRKKTGLIVV